MSDTCVYLDPADPDVVFVAPPHGDVVTVDGLSGIVDYRSHLPESAVELWTPQEVRDSLAEHLVDVRLSASARSAVNRALDQAFGPVSKR